jgi:transcriptional regulator of acetoin/glycerol metabolism
MEALLRYRWPGNVRELDHTIERAVLLADGTEIRVVDLALSAPADTTVRLDQLTLEEVEKLLVQKALARAGGNVTDAAKALGLSRSAMYRRLERYGL